MNEKMRILGLGSMLFLFLGVNAEGIHFENLTLDEALAKARIEKKLVFIDVFATWCGPCKYLSNEVFVDSELGNYINENFVSIKINGEEGEGPQLMYYYGLDAYPTMLMLSPEKVLRKKIVGAVSAEHILSEADEAIYPEKTEIYQLQKRYDSGERSREFMASYLVELKLEDLTSDEIVEYYYLQFTDLNLKEKADFIVFAERIHGLDHPLVSEFLENVETWKELHSELAEQKMSNLIIGLVHEAVMSEKRNAIGIGLDRIYEPYQTLFGEYAYEKEKLLSLLLKSYNENVSVD